MKKFWVYVIILLAVIGIFAALQHSPRSPFNRKAETEQAAPPSSTGNPILDNQTLTLPLVSLDGSWYYEKNDLKFAAEVADNSIKIDIVTSPGESMAYWHGSFKSAESPGNTITSEALHDGFVMSSDQTKDFAVNEDSLVFKFTALGATSTIELQHA